MQPYELFSVEVPEQLSADIKTHDIFVFERMEAGDSEERLVYQYNTNEASIFSSNPVELLNGNVTKFLLILMKH